MCNGMRLLYAQLYSLYYNAPNEFTAKTDPKAYAFIRDDIAAHEGTVVEIEPETDGDGGEHVSPNSVGAESGGSNETTGDVRPESPTSDVGV